MVFAVLLLGAIGVFTVPDQAQTIGPVCVFVGLAACALTILRKTGAMDDRERVAWRLVGFGFALVAAGILTMAVTDIVAGPVPAFGPIDLFFLTAYGLIVAGFAILPHQAAGQAQRVRVLLDSLIGALAIGAFMWVLVLDDLLTGFAGTSAWNRWVGTAYPIIDVGVLILVTIVITRRTAFRFDPRIMLFGLGGIAQVVADILYLRAGIGTTFAGATPEYLPFLCAAALYYGGALILDRRPAERSYADRKANVWAMIAPYTAVGALIVLLLVVIGPVGLDFDVAVAFYVSLLVGLLVVVRQTVAIRENRMLVERQRSALVSSISHELRTPLTSIVGFLKLLADGETELDDEVRAEIVATASRQARYLQQIVADLEPLKEQGPDDMVLDEAVTALAEVATQAAGAIEIGEARVSFEIEPGLEACIDARRVQQVMVNLVTNAARYGGGTVLVEVGSDKSDLVIEVHDDGPGVPKKWELAIWSRFERGANRVNAVQPGSGIGLAVVAAIVKAHGGRVGYAQSERLGGACFRVMFAHRVVSAREHAGAAVPVASGV
ncbi:MAG: HAMP domain-containing histidine kinase [Acidimicrobiia bacterium]|nr:HAMP domain-containing histidine kinase [Acidimicrobiia bacterium]